MQNSTRIIIIFLIILNLFEFYISILRDNYGLLNIVYYKAANY